jgi:hypothetical protein
MSGATLDTLYMENMTIVLKDNFQDQDVKPINDAIQCSEPRQ